MKKDPRRILILTALVVCMVMIGIGKASPATTVAVDPQEVKDLEPGETFTVNVTVTDIVISETPPVCHGLIAWSVKLAFDPDILNCTGVEEGPFLKQVAETAFPTPNINNTAGFAFIVDIYKPPLPTQGATGSGVLATVAFKVKGKGETPLSLELLKLFTTQKGQKLAIENFTTINGNFRNVAQAIFPIGFIVAIIVAVAIGGGIAVFFYRKRRKPTET